MQNEQPRPASGSDGMDPSRIPQKPLRFAAPMCSPLFSSAAACAYLPQSLLDLFASKN